MQKKFTVVHDTDLDEWYVEPPEVSDSSYLLLLEVMLGGFDLINGDNDD